MVFAFLALWLVGGVAIWRLIVEPKLVKWNVLAAMEEKRTEKDKIPTQPISQARQPDRAAPVPLPPPVRQVIEGSRVPDNIGGGTAVVDVLDEKSPADVPDSKITCVFEPVTDLDALSSLALRKVIRVHEVRLLTMAKQQFVVSLKIENLTTSPITAQIPKGQVFENKMRGTRVQNLAAEEEVAGIELPAGKIVDLRVDALCINKHWNPPNGGRGNITVLKIRSEDFQGQIDLWTQIEVAISSYEQRVSE